MADKERIPDKCPHCDYPLSSWQQILLNIDRALVCKNCWYRISLDDEGTQENKENEEKK